MSATATTAVTSWRLRELVQHAHRGRNVAEVFAEASRRLHRLVPFEGGGWLATDPATGLPTAPSRIERIGPTDAESCLEVWRHELTMDDVNHFRQLASAATPAAALRASTPDVEVSPRYRHLLRPLGVDDELRAVLRVGDRPWGALIMYRRVGQPHFTPDEVDLVARLAAPLGEAVRRHARPSQMLAPEGHHDRPGLLMFDPDGTLRSANDEARAWLAELPADEQFPTDLGVTVPMWIVGAVSAAAAVLHGHGDGTARGRVRTVRGQWVVGHASCLREPDGSASGVVVVLEPATSAELAPIIVEAYGLTEREQEITRLIARGAATADIARRLFLSSHTVRDHVKAVFAKVGVSSRGELVAKLFAEHYAPGHFRDVVHLDA